MRTWEVTYSILVEGHAVCERTRLLEASNALAAEREAKMRLRELWESAQHHAPADLELRWLSTREVVKHDEILSRWAQLSGAPTSTYGPWEYTGRGNDISWEEAAEVLGPVEHGDGVVSRVVVAACSRDDDARMIAIDRNVRGALVAAVIAYDQLVRQLRSHPREAFHDLDTLPLEALKVALKKELDLCVDG